MKLQLPQASELWSAIETYVGIAYDKDPPTTVRSMVATLKSWSGDLLAAPVFANVGDAAAPRRTLRLGNRAYPHMKLALEPSPDGSRYLFKADTHDRHICPAPGTPDHEPFVQLMRQNQQIAEKIESAWADQGLPTFKTYLKEDLARRQARNA